MIRVLVTALFLAAAAVSAQTPVDVSVANVLKACVTDANGTRDANRIGQLDASLAQIPNRRWTSVTQVAPGVHRITDKNAQIFIEIKLRDATGAAHCVAFGPKLAAGQGALTADKFVEFRFLDGLEPAAPGPGLSRRYVVASAPYHAELIAFQSETHGEVVGFSFADVPENLTTRALSIGDPNVTYRGLSTALMNAVNICLRSYFDQPSLDASLAAAGFELGYSDGRDSNVRTFFTPNNAVLLRVGLGRCDITTNYMAPSATTNIVADALNLSAPGKFEQRIESHSGCNGFFANRSLGTPMGLSIYNADATQVQTCTERETSHIHFWVAG